MITPPHLFFEKIQPSPAGQAKKNGQLFSPLFAKMSLQRLTSLINTIYTEEPNVKQIPNLLDFCRTLGISFINRPELRVQVWRPWNPDGSGLRLLVQDASATCTASPAVRAGGVRLSCAGALHPPCGGHRFAIRRRSPRASRSAFQVSPHERPGRR